MSLSALSSTTRLRPRFGWRASHLAWLPHRPFSAESPQVVASDAEPALLSSSPSPPPSSSNSSPQPSSEQTDNLSDQEWEIRTGRAIYLLQQTLPTFFITGLITSLDASQGASASKPDSEPSIYSPNIRLEYRPPTPLPAPFPTTLHVEGLPLYLGSSVFVRHTLNALYTDLHVDLQRARVHGAPDNTLVPQHQQVKMRSIREKSLFLAIVVRGTNRVSKAEGGWEVNSTYTFSPVSGLIHMHKINSIYPEPHQAFFSALQAALSKIGLAGPQGIAGAGGMARIATSPPRISLSRPGT